MANFGAKIVNNAVGALAVQQGVIATTANNIANVNTPGYARRKLDLETRQTRGTSGTLNIGNGVQIGELKRFADEFLQKVVFSGTSDKASAGIQNEFLDRVQALFSLTGETDTIGSTLTGFFSSLNDLSANPASIELRSNVIARGEDLVNAIKYTYDAIASMQSEADDRISSEVDVVNNLTSQIADLNAQIAVTEGSGGVAADERDQRTQLIEQLSEKIGVNVVELDNGTVNVSLANGFPLVYGSSSRDLTLTTNPSFATGTLPVGLDDKVLNYIVYDYDPTSGTSHADLTNLISAGGGTIGGLLQVRGYADPTNTTPFEATGDLVDVATRIEALTRSLLTDFNTTYLASDEDAGTGGHQPSSVDLDGNTPSVYGFFTFPFGGTRDVDGNGLPDDLTSATLGISNFSSILQVEFSDPRRLAAGRDMDSTAGAISSAPGDGRNIDALLGLRTTNQTFALGSFSLTGTYEDLYNSVVTRTGTIKSRAERALSLAEDSLTAALNKRDEVSGVSLDEEFADLIKFQRAYQASARVLSVADRLLEQVVSLV